MRLLFIHAERIWFKVGKPTPIAEELTDELREDEMENALLAFSCVESFDEKMPEKTLELIEKEIVKACGNLKIDKVMIFPFAHLSSNLSNPKTALQMLKDIQDRLRNRGLKVGRAAFGWNKEFELKSKGHPMAVLSKRLCPAIEGCKKHCPYCEGPLSEF